MLGQFWVIKLILQLILPHSHQSTHSSEVPKRFYKVLKIKFWESSLNLHFQTNYTLKQTYILCSRSCSERVVGLCCTFVQCFYAKGRDYAGTVTL